MASNLFPSGLTQIVVTDSQSEWIITLGKLLEVQPEGLPYLVAWEVDNDYTEHKGQQGTVTHKGVTYKWRVKDGQ